MTAIPDLLKMLDLRDALVSIDAMACQPKITKAIISLLAVRYLNVEELSVCGVQYGRFFAKLSARPVNKFYII